MKYTTMHAALIAPMLFLWFTGHSQQPVLVVKSFEYIGQRDFSANDSAKALIKNSFARAIRDRWDMVMPEVSMSAGPPSRINLLTLERTLPKFDTQLKDKKPGNWYLFLQVIEAQDYSNALDERTFYTVLNLKCKLINGTDGSLVLDRNLKIDIHKEPAPADQILLTRFPGYPASFVMAFDSIAKWTFQSEAVSHKSMTLKPACAFEESVIKDKPNAQLSFKREEDVFYQLNSPLFSFHTSGPIHKRTVGETRRFANGAITLLTGLNSSKSTSFECSADFTFTEADSIYHCYIAYGEQEVVYKGRKQTNGFEESSLNGKTLTNTGYEFSRFTHPAFVNVVTLGKDTLSTFSIKEADAHASPTNHDKMWDGSDSTTVISLPPDWNNKKLETRVTLSGEVEGTPFSMKTSNDARTKEFYINNQLMAIMRGKNEPVSGFVFHPVSTHQLKLFTILSSLPYGDFNSVR